MTGYWTRFAAPRDPNAPEMDAHGASSPAVLSLAHGPAGIRTVDAAAEHHRVLRDSVPPF
ncbi:hypothetical protein [Streptomyces sp. ISL-66]|uniref:hypothetical protein n=1 Tax=Streptomyces sp. ISL-66 TaxID=2819186 RepID=UPI0020354E9F|nr:hypothetical protein [Streptomyces sp. ISL-66]